MTGNGYGNWTCAVLQIFGLSDFQNNGVLYLGFFGFYDIPSVEPPPGSLLIQEGERQPAGSRASMINDDRFNSC